MADGRLCQPQALGGGGDRALLVDSDQQGQGAAVQIKMGSDGVQ
jgi:hypothetical protein